MAVTGPGNGSGGNGSGGSGGAPTGFYEPLLGFTKTTDLPKGIWLVSSAKPGAAPLEVTANAIDLPSDDVNNAATFYDWTYDVPNRTRNDLLPQFFVYGSGGHFFGVSLSQPGKPIQLSKGKYAGLCSLNAIQAGPFSSAPTFVMASVTLSTSTTACDTTWIIPTTADAGTAPSVQPQPFIFFSGLKDVSTGLATRFLVQAGNELDLYSTSAMAKTKKLLSVAPGTFVSAPNHAMAPMAATQPLVLQTTVGATVEDEVALVDLDKVTPVGVYDLPAGSTTCSQLNPRVISVASDSELLYAVPTATPSDLAYQILSVPLGGGTPRQVFASNTSCADFLLLSQHRLLVGFASSSGGGVISVDPAGSSSQNPVVLSALAPSVSSSSNIGFLTGDTAWVSTVDFDSSGMLSNFSTKAVDLISGHVLKNYAHAVLSGGVFGGFNADGSISESTVFLGDGKTTAHCTASLDDIAVVDPSSLASSQLAVPDAVCANAEGLVGFDTLAAGLFDNDSTAVYISDTPGGRIQLGSIPLPASASASFLILLSVSVY